jgi:hypothetical protein
MNTMKRSVTALASHAVEPAIAHAEPGINTGTKLTPLKRSMIHFLRRDGRSAPHGIAG